MPRPNDDDRDDDDDYDDRDSRALDRRQVQEFAGKKVVAGVLGILLGGLGVHKFVLGFPVAGLIMLMTTLVTLVTGVFCIFPWLATFAMGTVGLVEGIIYLTKSDQDFYRSYAVQKRSWF